MRLPFRPTFRSFIGGAALLVVLSLPGSQAIAAWNNEAFSSVPLCTATGDQVAPQIVTNRVWMRSDSTGLPGVTRIFLSDVTLLGASDLVLRLKPRGANQEQHFRIARVPYLSQEMKR